MGESVSTESQPPKLCSWILFPRELQVKQKSGAKFSGRKLLVQADLRDPEDFHSLYTGWQKAAPEPEDFGLR